MKQELIYLYETEFKNVKKKGFYSDENINRINNELTNLGLSDDEKTAIVENFISAFKTSGYELGTDKVKNKLNKAKVKKAVVYATAVALLLGTGAGVTKLILDKETTHEIVKPEEEIKAFDVNNKEQLKLAVEFLVEESAKKGIEITTEQALDFFIVANVSSIDANELSYLFNSKRSTTDIVKNFNMVSNKLTFDAFTVKTINDFVNVGSIINNTEDAKAVNELQTLLAKLTSSIINGDKETREKAKEELTKKIDDLFIQTEYLEISSASNVIIIKQLIAAFTLENSVMDVNDRIAIYGSETCDKKSGSIFDNNLKNLEKELEDKYTMMQTYAIANKLVSEYEAVLNEIESLVTASVIADTISAVEVQLLAHTGSKEVDKKTGVPARVVTVTTTTTKPAETKPAETKPVETNTTTKVDPTKPVYTESEAEIVKKAIAFAQSRAEIDGMNDTEFMAGTASYYAKKTNNALYHYDIEQNKNNPVWLKAYKEHYWAVYNKAVLEESKVAGSILGKEIASINFKNNKTLDTSKAIMAALSNRPALMNNKEFVKSLTASFTTSYNAFYKELAEIKAKNDAMGIKTNVVITDSSAPVEVYNQGGSSFVVTPNIDVHYVDPIYAETDLVCVKDSTGKEIFMTLAEAREKGYTSIYRMVDGVLKQFPMPEKGKTR